jgi:hypothetical protein
MQYLDWEGKVIYTSKDGRTRKNFPVLEWLANLCSHIPNRGEQVVRCYGFAMLLDTSVLPTTQPVGIMKCCRFLWAMITFIASPCFSMQNIL